MNKSIECPNCKSEEVNYVGISSGIGNGPVPVINSHQYQCNKCGTRFQVKGEK